MISVNTYQNAVESAERHIERAIKSLDVAAKALMEREDKLALNGVADVLRALQPYRVMSSIYHAIDED